MTPLMSPHHPVQTRSLCLHSYMITGKHRNNNIIPRTPKKKFILKLENMLSMRETKWYIFSRFQFKVFFSFSKPTQNHLPVLVSICVICDIITGKNIFNLPSVPQGKSQTWPYLPRSQAGSTSVASQGVVMRLNALFKGSWR